MATFLYRLGRLTFRRRRLTVLIWAAVLAAVGFGAVSAAAPENDDFSIPGTEAQRAFDLLEERMPGASADGATARLVFRAPDGEKITATDNRQAVQQAVQETGEGDQVASVADPFAGKTISRDGTTAYAPVSYKVPTSDVEDSSRDALRAAAAEARDAGLTVEIGGNALMTVPDMGNGEIIGVGISAVVLALTFGSLVAAGMPLVTALVGVGIGVGSITALAGTLGLSATTSTLAMMIGLAVGIDYALFIVSRYRSEVAGRPREEAEEAAGRAVGTAGSAVVFAGLTVFIALAGLAVVQIPLLTKMGFAAAGTVVVAVLVALTLIPALLGFAGTRVHGRKARRRMARDAGPQTADGEAAADDGKGAAREKAGTRWARFVLRRPLPVLLLGILGLGAVAVPAASLELGLPDEGSQPTDTTQRKAYDMLAESFGPGVNGPLLVVVDTAGADDAKAAVGEVAGTVKDLDGIAATTPPTFGKDSDTAIMTVVPASQPSSTETEDLVHELRAETSALTSSTGAETLVTGQTAMNIDVSQKLNDALMPYLALVVGLAFLLLMIVFRSVLVPLKAALGFLLSVLAALGAVVAVFQWGWLADLFGVEQTGPIMSMTPILMVGVVFGLAMDYEVFLVTRMREAYAHGEGARNAVVTGFRDGARVVTAAAVIMISVFAGFIGASDSMIKMIGFGLAVAVLFDAFVVRMAIVPAVLALLGDKAWWLPRWLGRVLPDVDVEGEALHQRLTDDTGSSHGGGSDGGPAGQNADRTPTPV